MRIEKHYGRSIVCGHIFKASSINPGQYWQSSSGSIVLVTQVSDGWVSYMQHDGVPHAKEAFAFQCRYCLVINDESEIPSEEL